MDNTQSLSQEEINKMNQIEYERKDLKSDEDVLYDADPNCIHEIKNLWSGIKCKKCKGWFCY